MAASSRADEDGVVGIRGNVVDLVMLDSVLGKDERTYHEGVV